MDLYEYQGKQLFIDAGIAVPRSWMLHPAGPDPDEIASTFGLPLVAKAQVLSGGRGKAGGVRVARTRSELEAAVATIMAMSIGGKPVAGVLLEEAVDIAHEYYLAITIDRHAGRPLLLFSTRGGMDIEEVARRAPQAIRRAHIDPLVGLDEDRVRELAQWAGLADDRQPEFTDLVWKVWRLFCSLDATLIEINPLVRAGNGGYLALDSKITIDDNALFRHADIAALEQGGDERERRARAAGFHFVGLEGDIGVVGNGAGMVMSTLDLVAQAGGRGADFLDVGGGARAEQIAAALDLVLAQPGLRALLVTIFGGITRCDEVARGVVDALRQTGVTLPVVVRLDGTNAAEGRAIVAAAGLGNVTTAETAWGAVSAVVTRAAGAGGS